MSKNEYIAAPNSDSQRLQQAEKQVTPEDKGGGSLFESESPPIITFNDMDNDGDADIVVNLPATTSSYWIENTIGKETESLFKLDIFRNITPTSIATGDVDGDGTTDVVIGHMSGAKIFYNDGTWEMDDLGVSLDNPHTILLEDVNKDGLTDVLIRDTREVVLIQNTNGQLGVQSMAWPNLGNSSLLAVGDIDLTNDALEILTLNSKGSLGMASHNGKTWQHLQTISSATVNAFEITDMNGDGRADISIENRSGNKIWLESNGTGSVVFHTEEAPTPVTATPVIPVVETFHEETETTSEPSLFDSLFSPAQPSPAKDEELKSVNETPEIGMRSMMFFASPPPTFTSLSRYTTNPVDPGFDFKSLPNMEFDGSSETMMDYSSHREDMIIDLEYGEASELTLSSFGTFLMSFLSFIFGPISNSIFSNMFGSRFNTWATVDEWENTDEMVNATGSTADDTIYGNDADNYIDGNDGDDWLEGQDGDDTLAGSEGDDIIFGDKGDDVLHGNEGNDVLFGNSGKDLVIGGLGKDDLYGGRANDTLAGGNGADNIDGGRGDDLICGGMGTDTLIGGSGNDTFHYVSANEGGDLISDFTSGKDSFEFEFGSKTLYTVTDHYTGELDVTGEAFVWEETGDGSGKLYYDADTSTTGDETLIAEVELTDSNATLTVDDISIV